MIYKFIDDKGTFEVSDPSRYNAYFPLTDQAGSLLSAITPLLSGDIKKNNDHFLTIPASSEDTRSSLLCRREFFIKTSGALLRLSQSYSDTLIAGLLYHKLIKKTQGLRIEITNFIPHDCATEVMRIRIVNESTEDKTLTATSFIPLYGRSEKNLRDHRHVSSLLNRVTLDTHSIVLAPTMIFDEKGHRLNSTRYYALAYEGQTLPPLGQFPTLDSFYGSSDVLTPDAIFKDTLPVTTHKAEFDGKEACAAFRFQDKVLHPQEYVDYVLLLGIEENQSKLQEIFSSLNTPEKIERKLALTQAYWINLLTQNTFDFKDPVYNNWLLWVRLQPTLRKLFGCSFLPHFDYGKGGRGWRDLWQDSLTLLLTEEKKAKELISNSFKGVRIDGSNATIISGDGSFVADRNKISRVWMDHGVWPYLTLASYIHKSGDLGVLLKETTYFRDHQLKRASATDTQWDQKDFSLRSNNKIYNGSILEHVLIQNLVQFFNVGKHNIIRLENADWNDGLDMASTLGESVAFSFMYAHNLRDLCTILAALKKKTKNVSLLQEVKILLDSLGSKVDYNDYKDKQCRLKLYLNKTMKISGKKVQLPLDKIIADLQNKSEHLFAWLNKKEWLDQGYFNGYYDNKGKRVEGSKANKTTLLLQSQVFAIMSGGTTREQVAKTFRAIERYLYDKDLGGYRLNTDFGSCYLDLGRAFGFSYGDKENGAFFSHMVVMLSYALYTQGFIKEGESVLTSIYKMAIDQRAKIYPGIPEYFNNQGQGLYLYLTGSASWYNYTLLRRTLGIDFHLGDLVINPKLTGNLCLETINATFIFQHKSITVHYVNKNRSTSTLTIEKILIQGAPIEKQNETYCISKNLIADSPDAKILIEVYLQ